MRTAESLKKRCQIKWRNPNEVASILAEMLELIIAQDRRIAVLEREVMDD